MSSHSPKDDSGSAMVIIVIIAFALGALLAKNAEPIYCEDDPACEDRESRLRY